MFVVVPLLFFVPGLVVGAVLGLRGWRLAAVAPAVTFGLVATGGPVMAALGVRWSLPAFAAWAAGAALFVFTVLRLWVRLRRRGDAPDVEDPEGPERRARWEHGVAGGGVLAGMAVGALVFLRGTGGLSVTSQDWDAPFHANAVRWIAEHGVALPSAIAPIANVPADAPYFYPITYHSLLALVVQSFGAAPMWVLNAAALTIVLIWPLGVAALGMAWRLPAPVVGVAAAVSTWFTAFPYDSLGRGPLWPFVAGLALLPAVLAVGRLLIERFSVPGAAAAVALAVTGVVAMHPSLAFILVVYVLALAAALVLRLEPLRWGDATRHLLVTGAITALVMLPVILPARSAGGGVSGSRWDEFATQAEGLGQVLLVSPVTRLPQWWLGLAAIAGMVIMIRRRRLVWVVAAYLVIGAAYAGTASMDNALVNAISGPFYNDAWRLAAPLPLAGALAVGEAVAAASAWIAPRIRLGRSWIGAVGVATATLVVLAGLGNGAYVERNAERFKLYGDGPTVSQGEHEAYAWLADHVQPGERVMNDRFDGSVWMYASAGVEPMVFTFYGAPEGSPPERLFEELNRMDEEPAIRRLVDEENVRYVLLGDGFIRPGMERARGLKHLRSVDGLEQVFRNDDAVIYEVLAPVPQG